MIKLKNKSIKKNLSQLRLTRLTCDPIYKIYITNKKEKELKLKA